MRNKPESTIPPYQSGFNFECRVNEIQNEIRAKHEMPKLSFDKRHSDPFSWLNAVGKALEESNV